MLSHCRFYLRKTYLISKIDQFDFSNAQPIIKEDTEFFTLMSKQDEYENNN
jgi:ATP-dependent Lon protease